MLDAKHRRTVCLIPLVAMGLVCFAPKCGSTAPVVAFQQKPGQLEITIGGRPFATYFYHSQDTPRPYFANVMTSSGVQATRNHPPIEGQDPTDHATYHPGIWLTFADINGHDYWRLRAKTLHDKFVEVPQGGSGKGTFSVRNLYMSADGRSQVCEELCKYTIVARSYGTFLVYDSTFASAENDFVFADQEEFGLGIRVNTRISVEHGNGHMTNAEGLQDGKQVWGKQSDWIDYSGLVGDTYVGMTIMPDPNNFRPSWYHARDYGFIAANPFGRNAMKAGPTSKVVVRKGEKFRLGFAVFIYSTPAGLRADIEYAYQDYLKHIRSK